MIESPSPDEHLVRRGGVRIRVAFGDAAVEHEAQALGRVGGSGLFPPVVERGVDPTNGPYVALGEVPADARPFSELGPTLSFAAGLVVIGTLLDAARVIERMGFVWDLQRTDLYARADGSLHLSRARIPRKLANGERLDARAVVEAVGVSLVASAALEASPRALRLLLPHVNLPGESGNSIDDVLAELTEIERELGLVSDDGPLLAGLCDPGLRRLHNEDAFACETGTTDGERWYVMVVCDGVSSSSHPERSSAVAAKTACEVLAHSARSGEIADGAGTAAVASAVRAAHVAVCAQGIEAGSEPPGTTIVIGLVWRRRLTVGWVGDSRAYWVSKRGSELITRDHSWVTEAVTRGEANEEQAMAMPLAHALTRCLGPPEAPDGFDRGEGRGPIAEVEPDLRVYDLTGPGWVVLCTDGFWNYFSAASALSSLVQAAGNGASAARVARLLVNRAIARGGHDNTTVLVYQHV